jgi:membrane protein implicated in regulation of membrane protease activity
MFPINDALDAILMGMFLFGLLFTLGSLFLGVADIDLGHESDVGHGGDHGADGHFGGLLNVSSILAFITWTGGIGYIARNGLGLWAWLAILVGLVGGLAGAAAVAWFLINVLRKNSQELDPKDWDQVGVIGRVTSSIRSSGYGEIVYEQNGIRQVASARAEDEQAIPRNTEVVVLRVEKGVAIVAPFEELLARHESV